MSITAAFNIVQIILAIVLIGVLLLQAKGTSLGGIFGGDSGQVYRTRRGFERRIFQFTIVLSVVFFVIALINSAIQ